MNASHYAAQNKEKSPDIAADSCKPGLNLRARFGLQVVTLVLEVEH